jgi:hypothetical protein
LRDAELQSGVGALVFAQRVNSHLDLAVGRRDLQRHDQVQPPEQDDDSHEGDSRRA